MGGGFGGLWVGMWGVGSGGSGSAGERERAANVPAVFAGLSEGLSRQVGDGRGDEGSRTRSGVMPPAPQGKQGFLLCIHPAIRRCLPQHPRCALWVPGVSRAGLQDVTPPARGSLPAVPPDVGSPKPQPVAPGPSSIIAMGTSALRRRDRASGGLGGRAAQPQRRFSRRE